MSILRILRGGASACGCLYGVYERYDGSVVVLVDDAATACREGHRQGQAIQADREPVSAPSPGATDDVPMRPAS
ncbi:MAG: hypothetical protein U0Q12_24710 [Vicinamibacterales bacterium]